MTRLIFERASSTVQVTSSSECQLRLSFRFVPRFDTDSSSSIRPPPPGGASGSALRNGTMRSPVSDLARVA